MTNRDQKFQEEVDGIAKSVYAACEAVFEGKPLLGYLIFMDENGNPVNVKDTPYALM